jgi:uncharacterized membrane protein YedE/YeeE
MRLQIAEGQWDAIGRATSKLVGYIFGLGMLYGGLNFGQNVARSENPSVWAWAVVGGMFMLSGAALLSGVVVPIIYKVIEKVGKDSPEEDPPVA